MTGLAGRGTWNSGIESVEKGGIGGDGGFLEVLGRKRGGNGRKKAHFGCCINSLNVTHIHHMELTESPSSSSWIQILPSVFHHSQAHVILQSPRNPSTDPIADSHVCDHRVYPARAREHAGVGNV